MNIDINKLNNERIALINLMKAKIDTEDWHCVSDCANDIREIDAILKLLKELTIGTYGELDSK